jgi:hypothetical protein
MSQHDDPVFKAQKGGRYPGEGLLAALFRSFLPYTTLHYSTTIVVPLLLLTHQARHDTVKSHHLPSRFPQNKRVSISRHAYLTLKDRPAPPQTFMNRLHGFGGIGPSHFSLCEGTHSTHFDAHEPIWRLLVLLLSC